ncbi:MAG: hypothetical protein LQ352_007105 [Teloschistes flavicans]|nr:MAG: hypothetical protein LQ352_007105 [Teloschistes flavicans]
MTVVLNQLQKLEKLAAADAAGDAKAHGELLKGISQLLVLAETPLETTSRLNFQPLQNICIRIAIENYWLQTIASRDREPVTAAEVSAATKTDELLIGESEQARETSGGRLVDYMRGPGMYQFADKPGEMTLFEYAHGTETIFELLEKNPEQKEAFDDYMRSRRLSNSLQWFDIYPAATEFANAHVGVNEILLVDIAGGPGQEVERFKQRYPDIPGRCVLQDLPLTLQRIDRLSEGIEAMAYDFFTPQPLKGARAYFLRNIFHNWSDAYSAKILSRVVEAMDAEYSILLIDDYVLPDTNVKLRAAEMDLLMLLHTSGIERTEAHWRSLCKSVGLEVVKIWSADRGEESVIEAKKIQSTK